MIGGARDVAWALMPSEDLGFSAVWTDLNNLVNNYCDSRSTPSNSTNGTSVITVQTAWSQLNLPWAQWAQDALADFSDVTTWLARYTQYLDSAQSSLPTGSLLSAAEQEIAILVPGVNFTGVTYGELVTDYNTVYSQFVTWYNLFFGPNGLVTLNIETVQDGVVPVYEFVASSLLFNGTEVFAVEQPSVLSF
jgi:hypothetical protein